MVFTSSLFLYFFIPVFFPLYYLSPKAGRNWLILLASLLFYAAGAGLVVIALLISVWGNHFIARCLIGCADRNRGQLLAIGVALNLAGLVYYKYTPFLWHSVSDGLMSLGFGSIGPAPTVSLPIGISFFTFQAISYIVDVYRRDIVPATSYGQFAVYHTLFPQLVAGPIVRYREISLQLHERSLSLTRLSEGVYRFCLGFGKKIILADNLGAVADQIIKLPAGELTFGHAWLGIICYALQIYYDFSGYSDMAIGLGKLLGFDFPENFDQPYRAANVTEFWRRWHMTLTRWFRDYVYIPLGGNQSGTMRTYINLTVVFTLCGLWHGAGLNFLIWGLYHGFLLVIERIADRRYGFRPTGAPGIALTLVLVTIGWVFFRIEDLGGALMYLQAMFGLGSAHVIFYPVRYYLGPDVLLYLAIAIAFALMPFGRLEAFRANRPVILVFQTTTSLVIFALSQLQLAANSFNPFIYFRF